MVMVIETPFIPNTICVTGFYRKNVLAGWKGRVRSKVAVIFWCYFRLCPPFEFPGKAIERRIDIIETSKIEGEEVLGIGQ